MKQTTVVKLSLCFCALLIASGCQSISDKRKIDYRNTKTLPPLDVPPDLTGPPERELPSPGGTNTASTYSGFIGEQKTQQNNVGVSGQTTVLPKFSNITLARDGQRRWLVVRAEPQTLWNPLHDFVLANGLLIAWENPTSGVIETEWAENRAKVGTGSQRLLAKWLNTLYSTGTRDKYRLRLERGVAPGTTDIYLTHQGMEEVLVTDENNTSGPQGTKWQSRPSDTELEAEMLHRLIAHLGGASASAPTAQAVTAIQAQAPVELQAILTRNDRGIPLLTLLDGIDRAWRRVGMSLDRVGFTVEDRDRSKGIYYVRYIDPDQDEKSGGWWSRLFSSNEEQKPKDHRYQVYLAGTGQGTNVEVWNQNGSPETSKTGERILNLLYEQLK